MDNVFIGANSTVMANVLIGQNVIIGANSLINRDCEPNSVYAGVPAKRIGSFDDFISKRIKGNYPSVECNQSITDEEVKTAWKYFYSCRE